MRLRTRRSVAAGAALVAMGAMAAVAASATIAPVAAPALTTEASGGVAPAPSATTPPVTVDVYRGGYATVNSFIVSNGKTLVLIDAQRKTVEAEKLAERIDTYHLPLSMILVTHGHTDHFTGIAYLHRRYPAARIVVATPEIARDIKAYAIYMDQGGATSGEPALEPMLRPKSAERPDGFDYERTIEPLDSPVVAIPGGGHLELTTDYAATEAPHMTTVYIPEANALFLADLGYNRVHLWLGDDITRERIVAWRGELVRIEARYRARNPRVYPGHGAPTDLGLVPVMLRYIDDFLRVTAAAATPEEASRQMQALYPDYAEANFFLKYSVENHVRPRP